jgi:hypothetical protein
MFTISGAFLPGPTLALGISLWHSQNLNRYPSISLQGFAQNANKLDSVEKAFILFLDRPTLSSMTSDGILTVAAFPSIFVPFWKFMSEG